MTTQAWVASLKAAHPYLPDHLTIEIEKDRLAQLEPWFQRVEKLRQLYDQMDRSELSEELRQAGKRQIVPVLMSVESMTTAEVKAWHDLFVCLSAMLADIAYEYYKAHLMGRDSSLSLPDVLNYLPVVFLYVLSAYDPNRAAAGGEHTEVFSSEKGRVRLSTWVTIDARRHINAYMQQHAHTVRRGSGAMHRLKSRLLRAQQLLTARLERAPSVEEIAAQLQEEDGTLLDLDTETFNIIVGDEALSLDNSRAMSGETTFAEMLPAEVGEVEEASGVDLVYIALRMAGGDTLRERCLVKLFETDDRLSTRERFALGV